MSEFRNRGSPKTPAALITFFREGKKQEVEEVGGQEEQLGGSGLKPGRPGQAADTWSTTASRKHAAGHDSPSGSRAFIRTITTVGGCSIGAVLLVVFLKSAVVRKSCFTVSRQELIMIVVIRIRIILIKW